MLKKIMAISTSTSDFMLFSEICVPYKAFSIDLSSDFYENLINIWQTELRQNLSSLPPLPNLRINLPKDITEKQLKPPEDPQSDAIISRSKILRSRWFDETIRVGARMAYKNTYGAESSIARTRKQLIDLELAHEFPFYICYMTAEVVRTPRELDADHVCSWEIIKQNIWRLIDAMNEHPIFAGAIMMEFAKQSITRAFIYQKETEKGTQYYPTKWFFRIYFNDISNLLLIKKVENEDKSGSSIEAYFLSTQGQLLYANFFETMGINTRGIIHRTNSGYGLGETMRCRFFEVNRDIVGLFNTSLTIAEQLNEKVREILKLRKERQLIGRDVHGRIRAEEGRGRVLSAASTISLSSESSESDQDIQYKTIALTEVLGGVLARAEKIAKKIVRELPESARLSIEDMPSFLKKLQALIKNVLEKGE